MYLDQSDRIVARAFDDRRPISQQRNSDRVLFQKLALDEGKAQLRNEVIPEIMGRIEGVARIHAREQPIEIGLMQRVSLASLVRDRGQCAIDHRPRKSSIGIERLQLEAGLRSEEHTSELQSQSN